MAREFPLVYCVFDGEVRHVSEFSNLEPKQRPQSFCPECAKPLTLKLSKLGKRIHHAAHKTTSNCILSTSEGVLHFNTKLHIFNQLKKGNNLYLSQKCSGWQIPETPYNKRGQAKCGWVISKQRKFLWLENWDEVTMDDRYIGNRKPDIVLYYQSIPIAAIEIFATHKIDEEKRIDFERLSIPWVEVEAKEEIYLVKFDYDKTWKIDKPLSSRECVPQIPNWTCPECLDEPQKYIEQVDENLRQERKEKIKKFELEEKRFSYFSRDNYLIKAKAVCFFYRNSGLPESFILRFYHKCSSDKYSNEIIEQYICEKESGAIIATTEKGSLKEQLQIWYSRKMLSAKKANITSWKKSLVEVENDCKSWKPSFKWDTNKQEWSKIGNKT